MAKGAKTGGRAKGTPNKVNGEIREMILQALDELGGVEYLKARAADTPGPFLSLIGKILPQKVEGKVEHDHTHEHTHVGLSETSRFIAEVAGIDTTRAPEESLPH